MLGNRIRHPILLAFLHGLADCLAFEEPSGPLRRVLSPTYCIRNTAGGGPDSRIVCEGQFRAALLEVREATKRRAAIERAAYQH
jgi:hypothetical protein